jgi:stage II sporulation protein D
LAAEQKAGKPAKKGKFPQVRVYLTKEKRVVEVPLESYVRGVVASEMPSDFELEALKAQALAARTYIVVRMMKRDFNDMGKWGKVAQTAYVTDSVQHQAYTTDEKLRRKWGKNDQANLKRIDEAVEETKGRIITYHGKPIYAAFFSTSNGRTENSEDYFGKKYPYLRSVASPWDRQSPKFIQQKSFHLSVLIHKLEQETGKKIAIPVTTGKPPLQVVKWTDGERIDRLRVGDTLLSGRKIREALNLASSDFRWQILGDRILITTRGYGHGVGMSQWGANIMAKQGKKVEEIIKYYYQGVDIQKMDFQAWPNP